MDVHWITDLILASDRTSKVLLKQLRNSGRIIGRAFRILRFLRAIKLFSKSRISGKLDILKDGNNETYESESGKKMRKLTNSKLILMIVFLIFSLTIFHNRNNCLNKISLGPALSS